MNDIEKLEFVTWQARAAMLKYMSRETCIIATRMVSSIVADLLGLRCQPLPVSAIAMNAAARTMALNGARLNEIIEAPGAFTALCRHLGPRADKPGEWWGGHLTMLVDGTFFVDASADQFSFAEGPVVVEGPLISALQGTEAFLHRSVSLVFDLPDGGSVVYQAEADDISYRDSQDWEETIPGDPLYDFVATTVEGLLELYGDRPYEAAPHQALPKSVSRRTASREVLEAREMRAVVDLGYTHADLIERAKREEAREVRRGEKHGEPPAGLSVKQQRELADAGESLVAGIRQP